MSPNWPQFSPLLATKNNIAGQLSGDTAKTATFTAAWMCVHSVKKHTTWLCLCKRREGGAWLVLTQLHWLIICPIILVIFWRQSQTISESVRVFSYHCIMSHYPLAVCYAAAFQAIMNEGIWNINMMQGPHECCTVSALVLRQQLWPCSPQAHPSACCWLGGLPLQVPRHYYCGERLQSSRIKSRKVRSGFVSCGRLHSPSRVR